MTQRFWGRAMGTEVSVAVVEGPPGCAEAAFARILELEGLWSRFLEDSELSQLNRSRGRPTLVSAETAMLLEHMVWAWHATDGLFDPTVGEALEAVGYDRDFRLLGADELPAGSVSAAPAPGCSLISVGREVDLVELPEGIALDPGGLGKGLAADLVATEVLDGGARSVLVDIGGDIRAAGHPEDGLTWTIATELPATEGGPRAEPATLELVDGGVATSSTLVRRWRTRAGEAHHVIDPRTGRCADGAKIVRVLAGAAWWAEAVATALIVDPASASMQGMTDSVEFEVWNRDG